MTIVGCIHFQTDNCEEWRIRYNTISANIIYSMNTNIPSPNISNHSRYNYMDGQQRRRFSPADPYLQHFLRLLRYGEVHRHSATLVRNQPEITRSGQNIIRAIAIRWTYVTWVQWTYIHVYVHTYKHTNEHCIHIRITYIRNINIHTYKHFETNICYFIFLVPSMSHQLQLCITRWVR